MIELTDEMRRAYEVAARDSSGWLAVRCFDAGLAAVLPIAERDLRAAIAKDIEQALAADEADNDVTSGEAIWEQAGYRRGLAAAAEIAAEPTL